MKRLLLLALLISGIVSAQTVNSVKIDTELMEVWAFIKPFNNAESYFMDYGQKKFRPHYYDHKTQRIFNNDGKYFEKGEWLALYSFLKEEGWKKTDERASKIGDIQGRVITFERD